ncbi:MAG: reverse transcriptase domain-containing protein, partial [Sweet potato little leaf phytoplasma]|nr:reverse transcriptase domain-containing protein [Sweet potato little leaf phytoplasma]
AFNCYTNNYSNEPTSYNEAVNSKDSELWKSAMKHELNSLYLNKTWNLVEKPAGKKIIDCKWVFKLKPGLESSDQPRYKARLVTKGFSQVEGVDYTEVFSPVVRHTSIRILLSIVVQLNLELEQMDATTTFLYGTLDELIFMKQPPGFAEVGREEMVCHLQKSLYGLKQSPRQWNKRFDTFILAEGFSKSPYDSCVYRKYVSKDVFILVLLYVDDILIASADKLEIMKLKTSLSREFDMKNLGAAKKILGMELLRDRSRNTLLIAQPDYSKKMLKKFHMDESKVVKTPLAQHFKLFMAQSPATQAKIDDMHSVPYANLVGSLMYTMVCSRPDLAHALSMVSRFMGNPGRAHWEATKWVLRYIKGTANKGLLYTKTEQLRMKIIGFVDSDYAAD